MGCTRSLRPWFGAIVFASLPVAAACGGPANEGSPEKVVIGKVYACDEVMTEARSVLAWARPTDGGRDEWALQGGTSSGVDTMLDAGYNIFEDSRQRQRAAMVCACRARAHRAAASARATESDALVWMGAIASIGGGAVEGVAASGTDGTTQKTLNQAGIGILALGTFAFGINAALNLAARSAKHTTAAETQEYAEAVLADDASGLAAWRNAWALCVQAEGAESQSLLARPQDALAAAAPQSDAGGGDASTPSDAGAEASSAMTRGPDDVARALMDAGD